MLKRRKPFNLLRIELYQLFGAQPSTGSVAICQLAVPRLYLWAIRLCQYARYRCVAVRHLSMKLTAIAGYKSFDRLQ
jgi:hypothetical protein